MDRNRIRKRLAAYGGDLRRWPERPAGDPAALAADPEFGPRLREERRLDAWLAHAGPPADPARVARLTEQILQRTTAAPLPGRASRPDFRPERRTGRRMAVGMALYTLGTGLGMMAGCADLIDLWHLGWAQALAASIGLTPGYVWAVGPWSLGGVW